MYSLFSDVFRGFGTMKELTLQGVLHMGLCCVVCSILSQETSASSLMKRIRERQSADHALKKGLDLESEDWVHVPQPVQDVLMSIDDKLRSLDTLSYTLKLARLDFSLDQLVKRMENIETKLGRLETKFDVRMEKVEEIVISKDIKEEFSNEHLSRRMENLNEKINNKAAYLDAKLEVKLERIMSKLELLERDLHSSVDDILEKLVKSDERYGNFENEMLKKGDKFEELSGNVQELRIFIKEDLSNSLQTRSESLRFQMDGLEGKIQDGTSRIVNAFSEVATSFNDTILTLFQESNTRIESLSASCKHVDRPRSITEPCDDTRSRTTQQLLGNMTSALEKTLLVGESKFQKLDNDVELYSRKVINSIQELWKTTDQLKADLSVALEQGNKTREFMRLQFRRLHDEVEPVPRLEPMLVDVSVSLDRKILELSATVDNSFATLLLAQNSFISSCRRIQDEEMHVYDILQQIVYEMRNRSVEDMRKVNLELQVQWSRLSSSLGQVMTAVWVSGNSSALALHRLQQQLKQKDRCVLKTDDVKWKVIDSLCRQVSIDMPATNERLADIVRHAVMEENVIQALPSHASPSESDRPSHSDGKSSRIIKNDDVNNSSLTDYEMDYPLSDADYGEHLND